MRPSDSSDLPGCTLKNVPGSKLTVIAGGNVLRRAVQASLLDFMAAANYGEEVSALVKLIAVDRRLSRRGVLRLVGNPAFDVGG